MQWSQEKAEKKRRSKLSKLFDYMLLKKLHENENIAHCILNLDIETLFMRMQKIKGLLFNFFFEKVLLCLRLLS